MSLFVAANFERRAPDTSANVERGMYDRWSVALLELLVRARDWFPENQLKEVQNRFLDAKDQKQYDVCIESHVFHVHSDRVINLKLRDPSPIIQFVRGDNFMQACNRFLNHSHVSAEQKKKIAVAQNKIALLAQQSATLHHELTSLTFSIQATNKRRFQENRARDKRIGMVKRRQRIQHSKRALLLQTLQNKNC